MIIMTTMIIKTGKNKYSINTSINDNNSNSTTTNDYDNSNNNEDLTMKIDDENYDNIRSDDMIYYVHISINYCVPMTCHH